jgi:predicted transposase YdaD
LVIISKRREGRKEGRKRGRERGRDRGREEEREGGKEGGKLRQLYCEADIFHKNTKKTKDTF